MAYFKSPYHLEIPILILIFTEKKRTNFQERWHRSSRSVHLSGPRL
jgi:hypothetical protein